MRNLPGVGLHPPQCLAAADPAVCEESIGKAAAPREAYRFPAPCTGLATAVHSGRGGGCVLLPCVSSASAAPLAAGQSHESGVRREGRTGLAGLAARATPAGWDAALTGEGRPRPRPLTAREPARPFPAQRAGAAALRGIRGPPALRRLVPRGRGSGNGGDLRDKAEGLGDPSLGRASGRGLEMGLGGGDTGNTAFRRCEDRFRTRPVAFPQGRAAPSARQQDEPGRGGGGGRQNSNPSRGPAASC